MAPPEDDASQLQALASGANAKLPHLPFVFSPANVHEQTVAEEQRPPGHCNDWVPRELLGDLSDNAEEDHLFCARRQSEDARQQQVAFRWERRVECEVAIRKSDVRERLRLDRLRVVHLQHSQLSRLVQVASEQQVPVAQCPQDASEIHFHFEAVALTPFGVVCAGERANGVRAARFRADDKCVGGRAVRHTRQVGQRATRAHWILVAAIAPVDVALIELAATHIERAHNSVRWICEKQLIRPAACHTNNFGWLFVPENNAFGWPAMMKNENTVRSYANKQDEQPKHKRAYGKEAGRAQRSGLLMIS